MTVLMDSCFHPALTLNMWFIDSTLLFVQCRTIQECSRYTYNNGFTSSTTFIGSVSSE